jgi:hypothetical protein
MKRKSIKAVFLVILTMIFSCVEPETVVTNIVHPDGSVTRKIEMKNIVNKFEPSDFQVPFDSTWILRDSLEFTGEGDTIWVKRAEKLFKNVDEINQIYRADTGINKSGFRRTEFKKKFKWFNTEYRFAEIIDQAIPDGYPLSDFLNPEELQWFYSPENIISEKENGPDSLKFRALNDTIDKKSVYWLFKNLTSDWIKEFVRLTETKAGNGMTVESLKRQEDEFIKKMISSEADFDSLWYAGVIFKDLFGEASYLKFQVEADSAYDLAKKHVFISFNDYTVRITMPGKVTETNGFMDSTKVSLWPVKSDYFLTRPYEMWAESKTPNKWAGIVTGVFLVFVLAGIIFRAIRKG